MEISFAIAGAVEAANADHINAMRMNHRHDLLNGLVGTSKRNFLMVQVRSISVPFFVVGVVRLRGQETPSPSGRSSHASRFRRSTNRIRIDRTANVSLCWPRFSLNGCLRTSRSGSLCVNQVSRATRKVPHLRWWFSILWMLISELNCIDRQALSTAARAFFAVQQYNGGFDSSLRRIITAILSPIKASGRLKSTVGWEQCPVR